MKGLTGWSEMSDLFLLSCILVTLLIRVECRL